MPTGRTLSLSLVVALSAFAFAALTASASAGTVPDRIIFPVVGKVTYTDDYGDPRWQGRHVGNDLMGKRWQLVVAAERGWVEKRKRGGYSCYLFLHGKSGTDYWYIHLNNDRTNRNDNQGGCRNGISWPKDLKQGQRVRAGQIIGYLGDSGDADGIQPHLHFEMRPNGGGPINPFRHLNGAQRLLYAVHPSVEQVALRIRGTIRSTSPRLRVRTRSAKILGGRYFGVSKTVGLDIPDDVVVERKNARGRIRQATIEDVESGDSVLLWTKPAPPSLANKRGLPGEWDARRLLLFMD